MKTIIDIYVQNEVVNRYGKICLQYCEGNYGTMCLPQAVCLTGCACACV